MEFKYITIGLIGFVNIATINAQDKQSLPKTVKDSIIHTKKEGALNSDRNVMLNASDNTKPREVNIGLPAAAGGMSIIENGLPVSFTVWPGLPTRSWRKDATLNSFKLQDLTTTAITNGGVGFTVETTDNLGTDKHSGVILLNSNHFGLLNSSINFSGPLNNKGLQFSVGAYSNYDPGFFQTDATDYYADQTQLYKIALSQKYRINGKNGRIALLYKYANSGGPSNVFNAFEYQEGGKVKEINGLKIGRTPFFEKSGKYSFLNPFTREVEEKDWMNISRNKSHTIDLIGFNTLGKGMKLDYTLRYHQIEANVFTPFTGQGMLLSTLESTGQAKDWVYFDEGKKKEAYNGKYAIPTNYRNYGGDIKNYAGIVKLNKKGGKHDWTVGISEQYYKISDYFAGTTIAYMALEKNPRRIVPTSGVMAKAVDALGNMAQYNGGLAFFDGWENKLSLFFSDIWTVNPKLTINYGFRLEWKRNEGNYAPGISRPTAIDPNAAREFLPGKGIVIRKDKLQEISDSDLNKTIQANIVYNLIRTLGILGEIGYNEVAPQLENYAGAQEVHPKQASIPNAGIGIFYNHSMVDIVSKATYIKRNNYVARITEKNPVNPTENQTTTVGYDIETLGWTTDVLAKPFKGFQLHFLFTIQSPQYKKYKGALEFDSGDIVNFDFSDKTVSGISKILMEIDPSYQYKKFRFWASARYFSKEYVNISNTIYYRSHWETFAGIDYTVKKGLKFGIGVVNPLNQLGAKGSVQEMDLYTENQMSQWLNKEKVVLSGTTIRPFTVEFSVSYRF